MSGKTSFVMHIRHLDVFADLPGDDVKRLMLAMGEYVESGIIPDFSDNPELKMAFKFVRADLDREAVKWEQTKKSRIEAGRKGGIASAERREQNKQTKLNEQD